MRRLAYRAGPDPDDAAKVFLAWRRIQRRDGAYAYAHRTLINSYIALTRRRSFTEAPVSQLPERAACPDTTDLRIVLMQALAGLAPEARAVVVLRYWEDRSVEQVADLLGSTPGSVRAQSLRALGKLRGALGDQACGELADDTGNYEKDTADG